MKGKSNNKCGGRKNRATPKKKHKKKQSVIFLVISEILNIDGDSTSSRMK